MFKINYGEPKVSIVIPVFNGSNYLADAINSALGQTYKNIEVVIVNDGSDDGGKTESIALSYGNRIRYFSKKNGGVASALNMALDKLTGEYFSWLSHDDLYEPEKIEIQMKKLAEGNINNKVILFCDYSLFSNSPLDCIEIKLKSITPEQFKYWLITTCSLHGCSLLIPMHAFQECGNFNEHLRHTQDYDLWFRMSMKYKFVHIPYCLVKSRQHSEQDSIKMAGSAHYEHENLYFNFILQLSSKDLCLNEFGTESRAYAFLAKTMTSRSLNKAAKLARKKALIFLSINKGITEFIGVYYLIAINFIYHYFKFFCKKYFPIKFIKKLLKKYNF